jgi:hypothetical protein
MIMNSKERVMRSVQFREVDRVPCFYKGVSSINRKIVSMSDCRKVNEEIRSLDADGVKALNGFFGGVLGDDAVQCSRFFSTDVHCVVPRFMQAPDNSRKEIQLGNVHAKVHNTTSATAAIQEKFPLEDAQTVDDISNSRAWPSPDWYDYRIPASVLKHLEGTAIVAFGMGGVFLPAMGMRGMENVMMDMAADKEMAHAVFNAISQFNLERTRRFLEANKGIIDIVGIGDDIASQRGLLMSKAMWREMLKPYTQQLVDLCNEYRLPTYFHGCGGFSDLFEDFIEMGIRCVGRLQPEAQGNKFEDLKKRYGKRICLWGAIDAQHQVVMGTVEEVRSHVQEILSINQGETGYVTGPSHSFTADTPIENVLAVYEGLGRQSKR